MCGICGKLYFDNLKAVSESEIDQMNQTLIHRGPDDSGIHIEENIGLGFRRLSIIDLNTGYQPLSNETGTVWIVFNGEIYNYKELRAELISKGHRFHTRTDTESIVHLYEEYGEQCVKYLRGMFAFAIWDSANKHLFCARDRFGIKPFYYSLNKDAFTFGSEIKAILSIEQFKKQIDFEVLNEYFTYGYISYDRSIFAGIKKLLPGHYLIIGKASNKNPVIKRYWEINFNPDFRTSEFEWIERIKSTFNEAVKMRLMSDVPLGAFLSGGIDSSSVVAMMARNSNQPVKTFSIGFKEAKYNELKFARLLSEKYQTDHYEQIIEPESVSILSTLVKGYDEPFADSSAIPTFYVSKFAKEHVTVALSGDGGDELFAGYDNYSRFISINNRNILPEPLNRLIFGSGLKLFPDNLRGKKILLYLKQNRQIAAVYSAIWHGYERERLFNKNTHNLIGSISPEAANAEILKEMLKRTDFISSLQWFDLQTYLTNDILTKVDRASMLNSLEVRVPILDHIFAELSFTIPSRLKYNVQGRKYIFKKAMEPYLPSEILSHPKQGFAIPLSQWFKEDLKAYTKDRIQKSNTNLSQFFDMSYLDTIKNIHDKGQRDFSAKIWSLLFFDAWYEQNFKN